MFAPKMSCQLEKMINRDQKGKKKKDKECECVGKQLFSIQPKISNQKKSEWSQQQVEAFQHCNKQNIYQGRNQRSCTINGCQGKWKVLLVSEIFFFFFKQNSAN